jgi:hypothetical protein
MFPTAAAADPFNPCDNAPLPVCTSALGPIVDVTADWRSYQAALVQPIPVADYASDPAILAGLPGMTTCGNETGSPTDNGEAIPAATTEAPPIAGLPAPPTGWNLASQYCVLRYIPGDFTPLCEGCARLLINFDGIPGTDIVTDPVSPGAEGHFALRVTPSAGFAVTAVINGHSPNAKNLCSDKFFNTSPGADCANLLINGFDTYGLGMEGDSAIYHHVTVEGRYYNGPYYLAGDGGEVPYHWVHGFYMDLQLGGADGTAWYAAGYRGKGDVAPDTDLYPPGYACACELLHTSWSTSSAITALAAAPSESTPSPGPGASATGDGGLPDTARPAPPLATGSLAAGVILAGTVALWRRRGRRAGC